VVDLLLTPTDGESWVFKRNDAIRRPLDSVGWVAPDGVSYLRPEVVLLFKAKLGRPKDEADFRSLGEPAESRLGYSRSVAGSGRITTT
jgi:hypothetical protein